jgi:class 3 adenylate cyclase
VNAATLSLLLGDTVRAHDTATELIGLCRRQLDLSGDTGDYFLAATMAEASLVLGDLVAVEKWSRRARGLVAGRHGLLGTTRRQFFAVVDHVGLDRRLVDDWLPMPRVVVFAGHMIDRPGREVPRFPADRAAAVAQAIQDWLFRNDAGFGFSSAACGGDILFQEAFAMLRGERYVVLPFPEESFRRTSVERDGPTEWGPRFEAVVTGATRVVRASRTPLRDESVSYEYANQLIFGLARARATELGAALETLVVSDGQSGDGDGGTSAVVSLSRRLGIPVHVVDPRPGRELQVRTLAAEIAPVGGIAGVEPPFGAVLFADAKGFSSLPDAQVPLFTTRFLGCIAALIDRHGSERFIARETWGDGMFFAFPRLLDAALFALDVTEAVNGTDWVGAGFSFPLLLRTALHYGPMYPVFDPIAQRQGVSGAHIAQAARLEPKTPPGQVYATEAFAARAALENHDAFRCVFVRQLDFDKRFGSFPTYVITRGQASGAPDR